MVHRNAAKHTKYSRDLTNVFDYGTGRGISLDALGKWLNLQRISIELQKGFHCSRHNKRKRSGGDIIVLQMATETDVVGVNARIRRGNGERNRAKYHTIRSCAANSAVLSSENICTFAMETSPVKL